MNPQLKFINSRYKNVNFNMLSIYSSSNKLEDINLFKQRQIDKELYYEVKILQFWGYINE